MNLDIVNSWAEEEEKRRRGNYGTSGTVNNSTATTKGTSSNNSGAMNLDLVNEWEQNFAEIRQKEKFQEELERPRKEYEAKVKEFDTKIQEEKDSKWQSKPSIFGWKPLGNMPSKKEKELVAQKAEFTAQTYNKKYSQEYRDKILAEKPKEVKLSDEQYISLREDVDVRLKYLNSVKANLTEQDNNLNKFTQWGVTQKNAADGTESVRKVPFLPTKELVAQSNTYNLQTDWSEGYEYLKKAAKESGMSEEEYAKSYNAQISGQMLDIYQKVVGDVSLTKEDIINTTRRTGIPAVDDNQIRIEIENINQYLDKAKGIYDEYTGVKEVEKLEGAKDFFSKKGGKIIGEKILSGTAPFANMFFNSKQEGFLDVGQIEQLKKKLENGEKLTTAETSRLLLTDALETNGQIDRGTWTRVAEGTPEALAMIGEMAATYGIFAGTGTAVRTAGTAATQKISYQAAKEIVETAAQEGGKNWVRTLFAKGGFKEGSKMIAKNVAVALIAEVPETIAKDSFKIAAEVMKTDSRISFSDPETEQEFMKIVRDDEEYNSDWANDLTKAFARQYFNNVLERGGGEIIEAPIDIAADKLKMLVIGKYMSQKGIQTLDEFSKVYDAVGFQGMFGEVFEEYAQDYAESIIDNRDFVIDDPDKFWDIVAQVGVLQLGRAGSVATTVVDVTSNIARGITFDTNQQAPAEGEAQVDTQVGQDLDTLITTEQGESIQDDLDTKTAIRQQQISGNTQTIQTEPVDDATLLSKAQALSDISKQTDYSLSSLTELKKLEKQATDEKTAQAIATISDSYANVLAKKVADGSVNIGQQIQTQFQGNTKEISPDTTLQEETKSTKQEILQTPNKQYYVQEKGRFKEIKDAKSIKIINEADTFIYRDPESRLYQVVEAKSGMAIAEAATRDGAIQQATTRLNKWGVETFQSKIQEAISKRGVSPRYIKKEIKKEAVKKETKKVEVKEEVTEEPITEKDGIRIGSKIKVNGELREVSEFGKSARDSQGVLVKFADGTYLTLDKAKEYAAQKQTKDAVKKESTQKTKEAVKEAEETVRKIEKEKKVDQNQLAKRRMDIGKTNPEVKKIAKDLKDFQESEDYVALNNEYKILLKEAGVTHSSLEGYMDNMIEMYGEEAATYLEDFMQRWTTAQEVIQDLKNKRSELINNQLKEEGFDIDDVRYKLDITNVSPLIELEDEYKSITGSDIPEEMLDKILRYNKQFFKDENVRIFESMLSEKGQRILGRYYKGWVDLLNGREDIDYTFSHESWHKFDDLYLDEKTREKARKEMLKKLGEEEIRNRYGNYADDSVFKYLYAGNKARTFEFKKNYWKQKGFFSFLYDKQVRFEIDDRDARLYVKVGEGKHSDNLSKLFTHKKLYENYPEIKDVKLVLEIDPATLKSGGYLVKSNYSEITKSYTNSEIHVTAKTRAEATEMILHEIQHWIQYKEGFARGGNPAEFTKKRKDTIDALVKRKIPLNKALKEINDSKEWSEMKDIIWKEVFESDKAKRLEKLYDIRAERALTLPEALEVAQIQKDFEKFEHDIENSPKYREMTSKWNTLSQLLNEINSDIASLNERELWDRDYSKTDFEQYQKMAGEVEARDVESRRGLTPDKRKTILPLSGEGLVINDLIVRYRGADYDSLSLMIDEALADGFADYVAGRETFTGAIKEYFDALWELLKSLVGAESEIKKLYRELYSGKLSEKQIDNIQKQYIPKYRADLLFDEEAEQEPTKPSEPSKSLEITKTPEKGVVYDTKGTSILPSRKLQQQIEETLMSGQSTPATRSVTAFMPVIETVGKIKDSTAFNKIRDRYEEIQELDPSMNELKYKSMSIADITAKAMAFVDEYPAEARRVALGMELAPEGTTNIAVSLAYTEKMFEDGKWKQAREADRALSLRGTRLGQEIVSFKGRLNANSPMFFMEQVLNARRMVVSSRMFKSGSLENFAKMKQERMAEVAKSLKQIKLEKAEDFINKLIC